MKGWNLPKIYQRKQGIGRWLTWRWMQQILKECCYLSPKLQSHNSDDQHLYIHCCENLKSHESQISCYKTKVTHLGDGRYGKKCLRAGPYLFRFLGTLKIKCIIVNKHILWIQNKKSTLRSINFCDTKHFIQDTWSQIKHITQKLRDLLGCDTM